MKRIGSIIGAFLSAALLAACGGTNIGTPTSGGAGIGPSPSAASRASAYSTPMQESVVYNFQGGTDGTNPYGGLLDKNSEFYGTTFAGGAGPSGGYGTVFKVSPAGAESVIYTFQGGTDGLGPQAGLIAGKSGVLYGDTNFGGSTTLCNGHGCGTVFELVPKGSGYTERVLYAFQRGTDGGAPVASLLTDKSGAIYGTTIHGGGANECAPAGIGCGTAFKLSPSASGYTERVIYSFQGGSDGAVPAVALIADSKGVLYGTTVYGGTGNCSSGSFGPGCGTVFKLTPSGSGYAETVLYAFKGGPKDGANPRAALLARKNGALFGTTQAGGSKAGNGTVFELMRSGSGYTERVLYRFKGGKDGADPDAAPGLHAGANGALYSTTAFGGGATACTGGCGTVFKLTPSGSGYTETVLHTFKGGSDGATPYGSVAADAAGRLYGTTWVGGSGTCSGSSGVGCGTVFRLLP
jgi:uncharacterized repeat protein (TIGR03803 family)